MSINGHFLMLCPSVCRLSLKQQLCHKLTKRLNYITKNQLTRKTWQGFKMSTTLNKEIRKPLESPYKQRRFYLKLKVSIE